MHVTNRVQPAASFIEMLLVAGGYHADGYLPSSSTVMYILVRYNPVQYGTAVRYNIVGCNAVQHSTVHYSAVHSAQCERSTQLGMRERAWRVLPPATLKHPATPTGLQSHPHPPQGLAPNFLGVSLFGFVGPASRAVQHPLLGFDCMQCPLLGFENSAAHRLLSCLCAIQCSGSPLMLQPLPHFTPTEHAMLCVLSTLPIDLLCAHSEDFTHAQCCARSGRHHE